MRFNRACVNTRDLKFLRLGLMSNIMSVALSMILIKTAELADLLRPAELTCLLCLRCSQRFQ